MIWGFLILITGLFMMGRFNDVKGKSLLGSGKLNQIKNHDLMANLYYIMGIISLVGMVIYYV